jgi:drug/metabolite transporter (DMT)-like permease
LAVVLALASSLLYGVSDFAGGLLSRRVNYATVALAGQAGALVVMVVASVLVPATAVGLADLAWGGLSGVGTGIGMVFLFRGLSHGSMSVVVPVVAVGGLALPVLISVVLMGDRPSALAWIGIVVAAPAMWFVTRGDVRDAAPAAGVTDALISSVGIAVQYIGLAQAGPDSGLWSVAAGRLTAIVAIVPFAVYAGGWFWPRLRPMLGAVGVGVLAAWALVCYLLATREALVAVAVVLSSLYPAIPVVLGITVLRERLTLQQSAGLIAAGAAVGLLAVG